MSDQGAGWDDASAEQFWVDAISNPETQNAAVNELVDQLGESGTKQLLEQLGFEVEQTNEPAADVAADGAWVEGGSGPIPRPQDEMLDRIDLMPPGERMRFLESLRTPGGVEPGGDRNERLRYADAIAEATLQEGGVFEDSAARQFTSKFMDEPAA